MSTRRKFLVQGGMAATAVLAAKPFKAFSSSAAPFLGEVGGGNSILFLHTNNIFSGRAQAQQAALVESLKKSHPHAILLDVEHSRPAAATAPVNPDRYDATLPGHQRFGNATSREQLLERKAPVVVSNYAIHDTRLQAKTQPYRIIQKGRIRIGIIGAGASPENTPGPGVAFQNPLKQVSALATKLKEVHRCHIVVCLSNLGYKSSKKMDDAAMARLSKNVDIIVGGHASSSPRYPMIVLNKNNEEVIISHAGSDGLSLGQIEIELDENGKKRGIRLANKTGV